MCERIEFEFVDTNILVYAHDVSSGDKNDRAKALIENLWESETGCLSVQVLQEFFVTVTRKVAKPIDSRLAADIIRELSAWKIHSPESADILGAIDLHTRYQISFWDAMILWSAQSLGCQKIFSEDLDPDRDYDGVRVVNPFI